MMMDVKETIASSISLPSGIIDIASANGHRFFHIHHHGTKIRLFESYIAEDKSIQTTLLSNDCGLSKQVIGFATAGDATFSIIERRGNSTTLQRYTLHDDFTFQAIDQPIPYKSFGSSVGLGWLDKDRFQHLRQTRPGSFMFMFSFLLPNEIVDMPLRRDDPFQSSIIGCAAWVERGKDSITTSRNITIRFQ